MTISEEVIKIHGISNESVKDAPTFKELSARLIEFIGNADLAGYNSNKFDIPLLAEEFIRVGSDFDLSNRHFVDVQNIFHKMEQRTLSAAYQFYCKKELVDAHDAMNDTNATWEVLKSQLEKYDNLEQNIPFLAQFSLAGNLKSLDFAGRLVINEQGEGVYNFGKHKGKTIKEVHELEPGYYSWFISPNTDFPLYTKKKLREEMDKIKQQNKEEKVGSDDLNSQLAALKSKFSK
jgi:DNA polymerase-3 subunit epsilon